MSEYLRSSQLASAEQCFVLVVDVQERILKVIPESETLIERSSVLLRGARELEVPILGTEQYPEGLGRTVQPLRADIPSPVSKKTFSSVPVLELPPAGERPDGRFRAVLIGIETHVCMSQTAFDLQSLGYEVIVLADATTSRYEQDCEVALQRMADAGMTISTVEGWLFECCQTADHPCFKALSRIVTGRD